MTTDIQELQDMAERVLDELNPKLKPFGIDLEYRRERVPIVPNKPLWLAVASLGHQTNRTIVVVMDEHGFRIALHQAVDALLSDVRTDALSILETPSTMEAA